MPVELDILENGHVVRYIISDPWVYDEFKPFEAQELAYRETVSHKVHNLTVANVHGASSGFLQTRNAPSFKHRTAGHLAIVGLSHHIRTFANMLARLAHFEHIRFFETEDQALEYLRGIILAEDQPAKK